MKSDGLFEERGQRGQRGSCSGELALVIVGLLLLLLATLIGMKVYKNCLPDIDFVGTVVDEVTGEPISGAIALAHWCTFNPRERWFEGGSYDVSRIEEVYSDREGKVYIKDFWYGADWLDGGPYYEENRKYPQLTVYKPGYVAWNYRKIFIPSEEIQRIYKESGGLDAVEQITYRVDFGHHNRVIKLERWWEGYSHDQHEGFVMRCIPVGITNDLGYKRLIDDEFRKYELKFVQQERENQRKEFIKQRSIQKAKDKANEHQN
ncbi:hypothetical protein JXQ70_06410 [bacterium]|nr:hypothetical protein [bacterium]